MNRLEKNSYVDADTDVTGIVSVIRICKLIDEKVQLFDSSQLISENVYEVA